MVMLLQVDNVVINTDQIQLIKIDDQANYVIIFFSDTHSRKVSFPNYDDLDRFLTKLGRKDHFA